MAERSGRCLVGTGEMGSGANQLANPKGPWRVATEGGVSGAGAPWRSVVGEHEGRLAWPASGLGGCGAAKGEEREGFRWDCRAKTRWHRWVEIHASATAKSNAPLLRRRENGQDATDENLGAAARNIGQCHRSLPGAFFRVLPRSQGELSGSKLLAGWRN
ncbi:hypothetical protein GGTG_02222 [Gaeumannomyces tritici R3-111a-1]|uniref:Uncharacterized protein n=1 Tax=Gaeumannomyces tritici (strain R3-111a-1) TaxID=644352 RepID=J3NLS2_GAET3|nr:hypothetical protein GGTG_02222 [Gaeumannomyces tritici R3-111a-1]EJT82248.1 hypothetical protein GGTG_02222 [Gaeumannomyces tritici R3-111a-1]